MRATFFDFSEPRAEIRPLADSPFVPSSDLWNRTVDFVSSLQVAAAPFHDTTPNETVRSPAGVYHHTWIQETMLWSWFFVMVMIIFAIMRTCFPDSKELGYATEEEEAHFAQRKSEALKLHSSAPRRLHQHDGEDEVMYISEVNHITSKSSASARKRKYTNEWTERVMIWEESPWRHIDLRRTIRTGIIASLCMFLGTYLASMGTHPESNPHLADSGRFILHGIHPLQYRLFYAVLIFPVGPLYGGVLSYGFYGECPTDAQYRRLMIGSSCAWILGYTSVLFGVGLLGQTCISEIFFVMRRFVLCAYRDFPVQNVYWMMWIGACFIICVGCTCALTYAYIWLRISWALALGVPLLETALCVTLQFGYVTLVYNPRSFKEEIEEEHVVFGDQKVLLSSCLVAVLMLCESFRLAALFVEAELDDNPHTLLLTLSDQLIIETLFRLLLPSWWFAMLTRNSSRTWVQELHEFMLPTALSRFFNDLKYTVGYCRFPVVIAIWASRCAATRKIDDSDEMRVLVIVSAFVFIEEVLEDGLVVLFGPLGGSWHTMLPEMLKPQWASIKYYENLAEAENKFHPYQLVNNPTLKYQALPRLPSICMAWSAAYVQYMLLLDVAGLQWTLNLTAHMRMSENPSRATRGDTLLYWWPP